MDEGYREVRFDIYCKHCKHKDVPDEEAPCCDCLAEPTKLYSDIPVKFEGTGLPCHTCPYKHTRLTEEPCRHCTKLRRYLK